MKFSDRLNKFQPSATLAVNAKALELKDKGVSIINLAVGEPDFATPVHIRDAAKRAIDDGFSRYTPVEGIKDARDAVSEYFRRVYGVRSGPENVILTNGGKQSLFTIFQAMLNEGDDVLMPVPYWTSYPDMILLAGARPVPVPSSAARGFRIGVDDLDKALTPRSRLLVLNSPSNPTGVTYTDSELGELISWAIEHNIFVVSDEIYDQLVFPPAKAASASVWWEKYPDRLAVLNGLSKSFAMTGWRVGYTLAHKDLIKEMSKIQSQMTSNICSFNQKALVEALTSSYDCVDDMRESFRRRRDLALDIMASWPGVICPKPEGAFYLFPDVHAVFSDGIPDSSSLCTYLLEKAHVAVMPGEAFGDSNCIRFSYAVSDEVLQETLIRIQHTLF